MKIRLMYIVSTLERHGPTNQLLYLIKFLDKNTFDPIVVTLSKEPSESLNNTFKQLDIKIIQLNLTRIKGFFSYNHLINNIIKNYKPMIIQTHGFRSDRLKIKYNIPKIINIRTSLTQIAPLPIKPKIFGEYLANRLYRTHLKNLKKINPYTIVFCSKSLQFQLKNYITHRSTFISNGVNTSKYFTIPKELKISKRKDLGYHPEKKIYVSTSRLLPGKNIPFLINTFNTWSFLSDAILIIVGSGIEYDNLKNLSSSNDNIKLVGESNNVLEYLQISDYYISASKGEGLPNSALEAMSTGIPCILSDILPHKGIIENDRLGVTFERNNPEDLKGKILQINKMDYGILSEHCREYIIKNYSAKAMSLNYQRLYSEIINNQN